MILDEEKIESVAVLSDGGYRVYTDGARSIVVPKDPTNADYQRAYAFLEEKRKREG